MNKQYTASIVLGITAVFGTMQSGNATAEGLGVQYNNSQFQIETKRKPDRLTKRIALDQPPTVAGARMDPALVAQLLPKAATPQTINAEPVVAITPKAIFRTVTASEPNTAPQPPIGKLSENTGTTEPAAEVVAMSAQPTIVSTKHVPIVVPNLKGSNSVVADVVAAQVTRAPCFSGPTDDTFTVCFDTRTAQIPLYLYPGLREFTLKNDLFDVVAYSQEPGIDNYRLGAARINSIQMNIRAMKDAMNTDQVDTRIEFSNECQRDCQNRVVIVGRVIK